jgi:hypothetical protein
MVDIWMLYDVKKCIVWINTHILHPPPQIEI